MPALNARHAYGAPFQELPVDVLPTIFAHLDGLGDWHACTLVNKLFCRLATPFLYRTLDSRIISKTFRYHPSFTLLARPKLARYVRHVTETDAIHDGMLTHYPDIIERTFAALALCANLHSLTWIEESACAPDTLPALLSVVRMLPLRALTIRTHNDLSADAWAQIIALEGVRRVVLWCMEGPPRALHSQPLPLGTTLTHLELGRCAGVRFILRAAVFAQFPLLQSLRLKGVHAATLPAILACLPNLHTLDAEYLGSTSARQGPRQALDTASVVNAGGVVSPPPCLRHLTVRTSSLDTLGVQRLWTWICVELVPYSGLETFRLHAFAYSFAYTTSPNAPLPGRRSGPSTGSSMGVDMDRGPRAFLADGGAGPGVPRRFLLDLGALHGATLTALELGDAPLALSDVRCACALFTQLAVLRCAVACADVDSLIAAIAPAERLTTLSLKVRWLPQAGGGGPDAEANTRFTLADARRMMCCSAGSKLRTISVGRVQYTGSWELKDPTSVTSKENAEAGRVMKFVVSAEVVDDRWKT
ncbi:hypothetical protein HYPSUDRAFT_88713 [Hypholoma sublateritium FD-334 SS-4]|uniref:Uncharacterized protein n=1 Tax=Hypholoma sublateritium (strain FD-334 SS-4) TaxID=945553 RepID=A0A0D2MAQ2_HYPSF|nr:hypothetical protein HYPSUDRAFT_88713 [Hypholoma sublateritium FD-334 SS-4]